MSGSNVRITTPAGPIELSLPLPGLYNVYNALAATAAALQLGATPDQIREALAAFAAAFGRVERLSIGPRQVAILLVKNPAGANEVLRTLMLEEGQLDLWIALNDRIADGRDVSWIWDADFEQLTDLADRIVCSGTRAEELALRLKYAGVNAAAPPQPDFGRAVDQLIEAVPPGGGGHILCTYTAMLDLRAELVRRGWAQPYWET
jgi:UDP-N-acetylmuramyl tripeptide synthase